MCKRVFGCNFDQIAFDELTDLLEEMFAPLAILCILRQSFEGNLLHNVLHVISQYSRSGACLGQLFLGKDWSRI